MRARLIPGVRIRKDEFGGICYVPRRDDFFAATADVYAMLQSFSTEWVDCDSEREQATISLAQLGIIETDPATPQIAYSGPSFLGSFPEIPTVASPLVVNCFCTSHCPLRCVYCHADDLMQPFRETESTRDLEKVAATAKMVPAMVAVITGGDPLTRPERAKFLIEELSPQKCIVLDTAGVGDIESLMPILKRHSVHVRVSLDAISDLNDRARPGNRAYGAGITASREGAARTIAACVREGIAVTVQTVVSRINENQRLLEELRDWLIEKAVRNWVLHICVKGGSARRIERIAKTKKRPRGILPGPHVYEKLWRIISEVERNHLPIDVRCTDTNTTPNSVLLIGPTGDLYTEGYAHDGKVVLYSAGGSRPDLLRKLWPHIDKFGHARRYLNWNPFFFDGKSLDEICYSVPLPPASTETPAIVETEAKYVVRSAAGLAQALEQAGFAPLDRIDQRDEYFDNRGRTIGSLDYVVRLRRDGAVWKIAFKGPRDYSSAGETSRIELEVEAGNEAAVRADLRRLGLDVVWYFEKRRQEFCRAGSRVKVFLDEVPRAGYFVEFEGDPVQARALAGELRAFLGDIETRNYRDVFLAYAQQSGDDTEQIEGAAFAAPAAAEPASPRS